MGLRKKEKAGGGKGAHNLCSIATIVGGWEIEIIAAPSATNADRCGCLKLSVFCKTQTMQAHQSQP